MTEGYVYRWTDSSNGKKYIGSHNGAKKHYKGSGKLFKRAYDIRPECFTREILYTGPDFAELEELILHTLDVMNDDMYYNLTNQYWGGKLSDQNGVNNSFYGRKHTEESLEKMRDREVSDETREKMRQRRLGKKHSEETKKKISDAVSGEKHPFYGKTHTPEVREKFRQYMLGKKHSIETKKKMSDSHFKRPVIELSTGLKFDSIKECGDYYNVRPHSVSSYLKKNRPLKQGPNKGKHFVYEKQNN